MNLATLLVDMIYAGATASLASFGFFLTLKYCKVFLMSYGSIALAGAYLTTYVQTDLSSWVIALFLSIFIGGILGYAHFIFLSGIIRKKQFSRTLLLTWGVSLVCGETFRLIFGPAGRFTETIFFGQLESISMPVPRAISLTFAILFLAAISTAFYRFPKFRMRLTALASSHTIAREYGIHVDKLVLLVLVTTGLIAGLSGFITAQDTAVTPYAGFHLTIQAALAALIVGPRLFWGVTLAFMLGALRVILGYFFGLTSAWLLVLILAIILATIFQQPSVKSND